MTERLVVLSIDSTPSYSWLARRCLESMRASGTRLPVVVFVSPDAEIATAGLTDVEFVEVRDRWHPSIYLETWHRISMVSARRTLYLDADTVCTRPLEGLFDDYQEQSVYARQEVDTHLRGEQTGGGVGTAEPQVDWPVFEAQRQAIAARPVPVLNTGVVLLNRGAARAIERGLDTLRRVHDDWVLNGKPYPCSNRHIAEELAVSVMLGSGECRLPVGLLRQEDAPFYSELRAGLGPGGRVTHIWTGMYRAYLRERHTEAEVREYDALRKQDLLHRARLARAGILRQRWWDE